VKDEDYAGAFNQAVMLPDFWPTGFAGDDCRVNRCFTWAGQAAVAGKIRIFARATGGCWHGLSAAPLWARMPEKP